MEIVYSVIQYKSQNLNVDKIGKANINFNRVLTNWRMKESMSMRSLSTSTNLKKIVIKILTPMANAEVKTVFKIECHEWR